MDAWSFFRMLLLLKYFLANSCCCRKEIKLTAGWAGPLLQTFQGPMPLVLWSIHRWWCTGLDQLPPHVPVCSAWTPKAAWQIWTWASLLAYPKIENLVEKVWTSKINSRIFCCSNQRQKVHSKISFLMTKMQPLFFIASILSIDHFFRCSLCSVAHLRWKHTRFGWSIYIPETLNRSKKGLVCSWVVEEEPRLSKICFSKRLFFPLHKNCFCRRFL